MLMIDKDAYMITYRPCWLPKALQWSASNWRSTWLHQSIFTCPDHSGTFGPAAIAWLCVFYANVQDYEGDEAQEVKETDHCWESVGDVDDDESDSPDMVGENYGKVDVPGLLVPFLNAAMRTLLSESPSSAFLSSTLPSPERAYSSWPHLI